MDGVELINMAFLRDNEIGMIISLLVMLLSGSSRDGPGVGMVLWRDDRG